MTAASLQACFDLHVRSDIALPELPSARPGEQRPVVDIRLGQISPLCEACGGATPYTLQADGDRALLAVPGVARYLIEHGNTIVVEPEPGVPDSLLRLFLLGSAFGVMGHMRGMLLLHANAVIVDGTACAFGGDSGAGKSTLAGRFAAAGYPVLCDDVCAIRFVSAGRAIVWPGIPRLKLWSDAARWLGHEPDPRERIRDGFDKFSVPLIVPTLGPRPLTRFYELARAEHTPAVDRLAGRAAVSALLAHTYRRGYVDALSLTQRHFALVTQLASAIPVFRWRRTWGYCAFDREFARLCDHVANDQADISDRRDAK